MSFEATPNIFYTTDMMYMVTVHSSEMGFTLTLCMCMCLFLCRPCMHPSIYPLIQLPICSSIYAPNLPYPHHPSIFLSDSTE